MVGLATFRLSTSPLHRHCYWSQQDDLRTRIAGQVRVRAMQAGQTRSCGARANTQAPAHRDACGRLTRNLRSCPTLRLSPPPRPPSQHSFGQLKIVNRPTPQTSALFSGPHGLRVFGDLMSNISGTRGRPDMRFCVCGSPSEDHQGKTADIFIP